MPVVITPQVEIRTGPDRRWYYARLRITGVEADTVISLPTHYRRFDGSDPAPPPNLPPVHGRLSRFKVALVSSPAGAPDRVAPVLASDDSGAAIADELVWDDPAARVDLIARSPAAYLAEDGLRLHFNGTRADLGEVTAGAVVDVELVILEGWE
jgi:hypothetical protein